MTFPLVRVRTESWDIGELLTRSVWIPRTPPSSLLSLGLIITAVETDGVGSGDMPAGSGWYRHFNLCALLVHLPVREALSGRPPPPPPPRLLEETAEACHLPSASVAVTLLMENTSFGQRLFTNDEEKLCVLQIGQLKLHGLSIFLTSSATVQHSWWELFGRSEDFWAGGKWYWQI